MAGSGHFKCDDGGTIVYSGRTKSGVSGVGFYLSRKAENALLGYNPISDRIMSVRIQAKPCNLTIFQVYAPTSAADDSEIDSFYTSLGKP